MRVFFAHVNVALGRSVKVVDARGSVGQDCG